eukprot:m.127681 g.127681  ORF g.127681 m.127681 type:complete len:205 (-) comp13608_c0_seq2:1383-1997(-)
MPLRNVLVAVVILGCLCAQEASAKKATKTRITFFYTGWCRTLCDEGLEAVTTITNTLKGEGLTDQYEAVAVDCSSISQGSTCCSHGVNTYPTAHVTPAGSDKYWVYQGERNYDQMYFALVNDKAPKAMVSPRSAGALSCAAKALKYSSIYYLTRTMTGSAFLGALIGGLVVYVYVGMRAIKFGARKSDYGVLVGTVLVVYYMFC